MAAEPESKLDQSDAVAAEKLLEEFNQTYALPPGTVIKRMAPPFSPARAAYYRKHHAAMAKRVPEGPPCFWFRFRVAGPEDSTATDLKGRGVGWGGPEGQEIGLLVNIITGLWNYDAQGDTEILRNRVVGDWISRDGVSADETLAGLEIILRQECKVPIRLKMVEKLRKVIVVEGQYAYKPVAGSENLTDKAGVVYDRVELHGIDPAQKHLQGGDNLDDVFSAIAFLINRPVVNEVTRLPKNRICWRYYSKATRDAEAGVYLDQNETLEHLSAQTSLKFSEGYRKGRVLLVDRDK